VLGVNFSTGLCLTDHKRAVRRDEDPKKLRNEALRAGADLGIPAEVVDISAEYMDIITRPKYGYGKNVNPCIDCRGYMLRMAGDVLRREQAQFVFTGEVLGQRPMSQRRDAMRKVEKESGLEGIVLRPLSAQHLKETIPEELGWIDRTKLLGLSGRSRKPQMKLIQITGIEDYPTPAGGCCFLADENFAVKFRDLVAHSEERLTMDELVLLKVGRHMRLSENCKAILGRDEPENEFLSRYTKDVWSGRVNGWGSPLALIQGTPSDTELESIAGLLGRYSQGRKEAEVEVELQRHDGDGEITETRILNIPPAADSASKEQLINALQP